MKFKQIKESKPIIKTFYRKTIKAVKSAGVVVLIAGSTFTGVNAVREVNESRNSENHIIEADFGSLGSFVIYNRDNRTATQIFDDAINTALTVEGLEEAYTNSQNMTLEQKQAFLTQFAKEVAKSGGIKIKEVVFLEEDAMNGARGMYSGYNSAIINFSKNKIYINNQILQASSLAKAIDVVFHEVGVHAIEGINIQSNKNVVNLNPTVYNSKFTYADEVYYSNFKEISAQLIANKFSIELKNKFGNSESSHEYHSTFSNMQDLLDEIVHNDMQHNNRTNDYYKNLTVEEVIYIGFKNNYENKGVEFNLEVFKNSYSYEIIKYAVDNYILEMNYRDYDNGYGQYQDWNLIEELARLESLIESFEAEKYTEPIMETYYEYGYSNEDYKNFAEQGLARQMAKVMSIVRYNSKNYEQHNVLEAFNLITDNLNLINENLIDFYRLDLTDNINPSGLKNTNSATKSVKNNKLNLEEELEL
jgi:hypothetical protein